MQRQARGSSEENVPKAPVTTAEHKDEHKDEPREISWKYIGNIEMEETRILSDNSI